MKESEIIEKVKEGYKQEFNTLPENSDFLDQLKEENNKKKKSFFFLWLSKPIPAYSLALASLLFFMMFLLIEPKTNELIVYRDAETIIQYDTIVVRDTAKIQNEIDQLQKLPRKNLVRNISKERKSNPSTSIQTVVYEGEFYFDANQVSEQQNLSGSFSTDNELDQFLGVSI